MNDARGAFIVSDTARPVLDTLSAVDRQDKVLPAREVLAGFNADLTHECARASNRPCRLLLQILPILEAGIPKETG